MQKGSALDQALPGKTRFLFGIKRAVTPVPCVRRRLYLPVGECRLPGGVADSSYESGPAKAFGIIRTVIGTGVAVLGQWSCACGVLALRGQG